MEAYMQARAISHGSSLPGVLRLLVLSCVLFVACFRGVPVAKNESLQPYPGSNVIRSVQQADGAGVEYEVSVPYPSEPVLAFITAHVPADFHPRKEDFMNPGIPTSHVRGWTSYGDLTTQPPSWVHHWAGEWEDSAGNILSYDLMYRSPDTAGVERPTTTKLHVAGQYYSRAMVDGIRKALRGGAA
jgi:hypothetical protein